MEAPILPTNASENITSLMTFFQYINNDLAEGWFFVLMLFAIFLIVLILLKGSFTTPRAFAGSSFLCMVLSIILRTMGLIENTWMFLFVVLTGFSALWLYLEGRGG